MSNDKSNATYHDRGELPRRSPGETLASWDRSLRPDGTQPFGTGERPWVSPGVPPWQVESPRKRPVAALVALAVVLGLLVGSVLVGIAVSLVETPPPRPTPSWRVTGDGTF